MARNLISNLPARSLPVRRASAAAQQAGYTQTGAQSGNKIASNFKKLRAKKGYSQEKVARLADLSLNTVIRIESGVNKNPTIGTLTKLARALEVSVEDLIN